MVKYCVGWEVINNTQSDCISSFKYQNSLRILSTQQRRNRTHLLSDEHTGDDEAIKAEEAAHDVTRRGVVQDYRLCGGQSQWLNKAQA